MDKNIDRSLSFIREKGRAFRDTVLRTETIHGTLGLFLTVFFAHLAHSFTDSRAFDRFDEQATPNLETANALLANKGFVHTQDPLLIDRVIRRLPVRTNEDNAIWISREQRWVAMFNIEHSWAPSVFGQKELVDTFEKNKNPAHKNRLPNGFGKWIPKEWSEIGKNYLGFMKLIEEIEAQPISLKARPRVKESESFRHPLEIRY